MTSAELGILVKKQPIGFGCGALCVALAVLLYLRSGKIAENQAAFEAKSAEATQILANVRNSAGLAEQVTEIQALTKEMEARLVRAGQLAINQQYFYKLEAENAVKLLDVRQGSISRNSKTMYAGIPYNVTVQGSYKQILDFLQRLETGRHFCRFTTAIFSKNTGGGEGNARGSTVMTLTLNIELLGQP